MDCLFSSHPNAEDRSDVKDLISESGFNVVDIFDKSDLNLLNLENCSLLISDRTKFLFPSGFLEQVRFPCINTHPSLLPFHKGSQPVFWACILNHKLGVSLHSIENGIDTGGIYSQKEVIYSNEDTFHSAHSRCRSQIKLEIKNICTQVFDGKQLALSPQQMTPRGHHLLKDCTSLIERLPSRWHTTIQEAREILATTIEPMHIYRP